MKILYERKKKECTEDFCNICCYNITYVNNMLLCDYRPLAKKFDHSRES